MVVIKLLQYVAVIKLGKEPSMSAEHIPGIYLVKMNQKPERVVS